MTSKFIRWLLAEARLICYNADDMVQVTRKDEREANENIIRRFNRKVLQSGVLAEAKASMRFNKPLSKTERRAKAIIRKERKNDKLAKMRLGIR
jgi:ribosomal protein S21